MQNARDCSSPAVDCLGFAHQFLVGFDYKPETFGRLTITGSSFGALWFAWGIDRLRQIDHPIDNPRIMLRVLAPARWTIPVYQANPANQGYLCVFGLDDRPTSRLMLKGDQCGRQKWGEHDRKIAGLSQTVSFRALAPGSRVCGKFIVSTARQVYLARNRDASMVVILTEYRPIEVPS